jgi:peptidoglycan/LPS O-acetylase OafA/YrhL
MANLLFYLNYTRLSHAFNSHIWSLCVEMHFYIAVAVIVALFGRKGLFLLPLLCVMISATRISQGVYVSINTHLRADEILVGASLALMMQTSLCRIFAWMKWISPWFAIILLVVVCSPYSGPCQYFRPYAGGVAVGSTLIAPDHTLSQWLKNKWLVYLATISYALYVIHGPFRSGWFAGSSTLDRYMIKRPLGIAFTFVLAHLSTHYYEAYWIRLGKRLTNEKRNVG